MGFSLDGYWMDIGTPERYLQATWDILENRVETQVRPTAPGLLVGAGAEIDPGAVVGPRAVVSPGCPSPPRRGSATRSCWRAAASARGPASAAPYSRLASRSMQARGWTARSSPAMKESRPSPMIDDVLGIPDQLRDALWRIESARLEPAESAGLVVCGMGGSAIGADLATAALGDRLTRPLVTIRGYGLPSWVTPEWTVLCSSYSGNTEETLACFEAAEALGTRRIVVSTGGKLVDGAREAGLPVVGLPGIFQPRAAVAYMFTVVAEIAALAGAAPRVHTEIDAAAAFLEREAEALQARAAEIAAQLKGTHPVVYGADLTTPVARRWKCQVNENAKLPAFYAELPEADHNELCGWDAPEAQPGRRLPRGLRSAPAGAPPVSSSPPRPSPATAPPRSGSRPPARPASPACSGRRCWATWSHSSWPPSAGWTRSRSRRSSASRRRWGALDGASLGSRRFRRRDVKLKPNFRRRAGVTMKSPGRSDRLSAPRACAGLQLSTAGGLHVVDYFTPWDQDTMNTGDADFVSGGIVLLPDESGTHPHLMVTGTKAGRVYLVDRDNLGGYLGCGATCDKVVQTLPNDAVG